MQHDKESETNQLEKLEAAKGAYLWLPLVTFKTFGLVTLPIPTFPYFSLAFFTFLSISWPYFALAE